MNDYFTDCLAREHRADLAREVERDRRAAPLHEKATGSAVPASTATVSAPHRRWLDVLAHPFAHHPRLHLHVHRP
jgi:hypothetical protein